MRKLKNLFYDLCGVATLIYIVVGIAQFAQDLVEHFRKVDHKYD